MGKHWRGLIKSWPLRYFSALSPKQRLVRERELVRRRTRPQLARTNTLVKTKKSRWTGLFHATYPDLRFNKAAISKRTGIPRKTLDTVYNRGLKAWQTGGSRPGATAQQWAIARVYKYVLVTKKKAPKAWYAFRNDPNANLRR
jgi:hypothetical protein